MLSQILPLAYLTLGVHAGGCEVNPCMNGGQCYDIGENGYECICNSYAGKNCQIREFTQNIKKIAGYSKPTWSVDLHT